MKIRAVQTSDGWQLRTPHGNPVGPRMLRLQGGFGNDGVHAVDSGHKMNNRPLPPEQTTFPTQAQAEKAAFEWTVYLLDCAKMKGKR